jgi:hypothetical protein
MGLVCLFVETPEKVEGFQVLFTSVLVGDPFAIRAGVVQIEHRGHGVYA